MLTVTHDALERTRAPWLSVHLGFSAELVTFQNGFQTASETLERTTLISNVIVNVKALKAAIDVPLLLNNLDYSPTGAYEHVCEPEVIRTVLKAPTPTFSSTSPTPGSAPHVWGSRPTTILQSCRLSA